VMAGRWAGVPEVEEDLGTSAAAAAHNAARRCLESLDHALEAPALGAAFLARKAVAAVYSRERSEAAWSYASILFPLG